MYTLGWHQIYHFLTLAYWVLRLEASYIQQYLNYCPRDVALRLKALSMQEYGPEIESPEPTYNPNTVVPACVISCLFCVDERLRQESPLETPRPASLHMPGKLRYPILNNVERKDQHTRLSWPPNVCITHVYPLLHSYTHKGK